MSTLTLLLGRAGTGKTTHLLQTLCTNGKYRRQICIVPEQYSHEMERRLCQVGGNGTSLYAEVLSFTRLASRVFAEVGGLNIPQLDKGGKVLLMHRATQSVQGLLQVYRRPAKRTAFLEQLLSASNELKSCCIRPEQLMELADEQGNSEKLRELALILGTYDALVAQRAADPRDRLTRLAEALHECSYLVDCDVYVDCFTDFTQQELNILKRLIPQVHSLTVTITCDDPDKPACHRSFEPAKKACIQLRQLANAQGADCRTLYLPDERTGWLPELNWLEQNYHHCSQPWQEPTTAVELYTAQTPFEQLEFAAGRILSLVEEHQWHWRDIGVAVRSLDSWEEEIKSVFLRYGIPIGLNRMTDILQKPILALITSALHAITDGYTYDDMFRYLKTGLTGVSPEQRDHLENYVLTWKIKGSRWTTQKAWSWHPDGYGKNLQDPDAETAREQVAALDALRREIIAPLERLRKSTGTTGADHAAALYRFTEEIALRERLEERAHFLIDHGELTQAEEYAQLWEILCGALEQCSALLAQEPIEITEFAQLFQLVLSQYEVGTIPVSLDRVVVGDAARMSHKDLKCLIVLGADDTAFPQVATPAGLLTEEDRQLLSGFSHTIAPTPDERIAYELAILYQLIALPRQKLVVAYANHDATGSELRPSILFNRLRELFPNCLNRSGEALLWQYRLSAPLPALEYLAETQDRTLMEQLKTRAETADGATRLEQSFSAGVGRLSSAATERLYSKNIRLSATRIDSIKGCHMAYFMEYGLKLKQRKQAEFDSLENGTFIHYVLEHLFRTIRAHGGIRAWEDAAIETLTQEIIQQYITIVLGGTDDKPQRFRYLFGRLQKSVHQIVRNVVDELRNSDFQPMFFELEFGKRKDVPMEIQVGNLTLSINGKVDRIDTWEHEGKLYYRIVDYKSGRKSFDFTKIWNGLNLQMLVYLLALEENDGSVLSEKETVPAGVLYLPVRDEVVNGPRDMAEDLLQQEIDKALRRQGLFLRDLDVIEAMEHTPDGSGSRRFLPISFKKDGNPYKNCEGCLASLEQLGQLEQHIHRILKEIGNELSSGNIDADPYQHGDKSPCEYCRFASACHFEEGRTGNRRRYLSTLSYAEFWKRVASSQ